MRMALTPFFSCSITFSWSQVLPVVVRDVDGCGAVACLAAIDSVGQEMIVGAVEVTGIRLGSVVFQPSDVFQRIPIAICAFEEVLRPQSGVCVAEGEKFLL